MAVYPERRKGRLTGKWIAEVTRNGERFARKTFDLKRDADSWEGYMKLTGEVPLEPEKTVGPTFGEVAKEFLAARPKDADKSGRDRMTFVIEYFGDGTPLAEINTRRLDKLVSDLRTRKGRQRTDVIRPTTINRYLTAASSVLHFAKLRQYLTALPTVPWQDTESGRLDWLTEAKEVEVAAYMKSKGWNASALVLRVLTATGMRWGELAKLQPEQIEPETQWLRLWKTKNRRARSAPVPAEFAQELKALVTAGGVPQYYTFRKHLKAAAKHAGLPETFSIHALRHTTATRLLQKGVPLAIVQKYLGHKTITTTLKYTHVADEDLQNALEKISPRAGLLVESPTIAPEKVE